MSCRATSPFKRIDELLNSCLLSQYPYDSSFTVSGGACNQESKCPLNAMQGRDSRQMRAQTPSILPSHSRYATQEFSGVRKCTRCRLQASSYYDQAPHPQPSQNHPHRERIVYFFLSFEALFVLAVPRNSFDLFLRCLPVYQIPVSVPDPKNSQYPTNAIHGLYVRCCLLAFSIFVAMPTRTSL